MPQLQLALERSNEEFSIRRFEIYEGMSNLYQVSLWALCKNDDVDFDAIVGWPAEFYLDSGVKHLQKSYRHWTGIINYIELVRAEAKGASTYYVRLVPMFWRLSQRRNNRIFQHLNIPDIVSKILGEWNIEHEWQIDPSAYHPLEYRVQYAESDYAFISRMLQEAGIAFYFVESSSKGNVLVLSDRAHLNELRPGEPIHCVDNPSEAAEAEHLTQFRVCHEARPGKATFRDHDFRLRPDFPLFNSAPNDDTVAVLPQEQSYEQYRYKPGGFLIDDGSGGATPTADDKGVARTDEAKGQQRRMTNRLLAARAARRHVRYKTNVLDLSPGVVFKGDEHPRADVGAVSLLATEMTFSGDHMAEYIVNGIASFADQPYRPPFTMPKPYVNGLQSAIVVGPPGEEIYTDEYGRVRVQFHWDREGSYNDFSSVWMRVSQGWAGGGFGLLTIPRVGHEVLVSFLEGDPDQPIVVGRVFNATNTVPYKLPDHKTKSTWKSNSSPQSDGYNEILFEDLVDQELIYIQAERNLDKLVKNDETERTGGNLHSTVEKNVDIVVKQNKKELIEADQHLHVLANQFDKVDVDHHSVVGVNRHHQVGSLYALDAGQEIHIKVGSNVVIEAGTELTVKVGGNFVNIHSGGVDIKGALVKINSGGSAGQGSGCAAQPTEDADEAQITDPVTIVGS